MPDKRLQRTLMNPAQWQITNMRVQNFQGLGVAANTAFVLVIQQKPGGCLPKRALNPNAIDTRLAQFLQSSNQVPLRLREVTRSSALVKSAMSPDAFINVPDALGASPVEAWDSL